MDDTNSYKIGCRETGDFEMNPWMDITLESKGCYRSSTTVSYRIYYEIHEIDKVSFAQLRYIYNINSPSEFTIDGKTDNVLGGDEFNLEAKLDDEIDFTFNIPFEESYSFIQSKRNSVIAFYDIILPCKNLTINMKEKGRSGSESNTIKFDCDKLGVRHDIFQIGDDPARGKYRLISTISTDYTEPSFTEDFKVFSPVDRDFGVLLDKDFNKTSKKAVILKTLVNSFNVNDYEGGDEISLSVYSDVIDEMFKCGQFHFRSGDVVDFNDLVVPCKDLVTITINEKDGYSSDGHTVLVPCNSNSEMTVDLVIPKGNLKTTVDKLSNVEKIFNYLSNFNPGHQTKIGV